MKENNNIAKWGFNAEDIDATSLAYTVNKKYGVKVTEAGASKFLDGLGSGTLKTLLLFLTACKIAGVNPSNGIKLPKE